MKHSQIKQLLQATSTNQVSGLPQEILDQIPDQAVVLLDIAPFAMDEKAIEDLIKNFDPTFVLRPDTHIEELIERIEMLEADIAILKQGNNITYEHSAESGVIFPFILSPPEGPDGNQ